MGSGGCQAPLGSQHLTPQGKRKATGTSPGLPGGKATGLSGTSSPITSISSGTISGVPFPLTSQVPSGTYNLFMTRKEVAQTRHSGWHYWAG